LDIGTTSLAMLPNNMAKWHPSRHNYTFNYHFLLHSYCSVLSV